jgi:hypothetical protein
MDEVETARIPPKMARVINIFDGWADIGLL